MCALHWTFCPDVDVQDALRFALLPKSSAFVVLAMSRDQVSDIDLRERALHTIWVNGRATIPLMEEHIDAIAGVQEAHVETLGHGDATNIINAEDELINDID